jgi:TRAP-type C4-dicarboxylate transport system permease small subunit
MGPLLAMAKGLGQVNAALLALGRAIGIVCVAMMVIITLVQVVFRYGFNDALAWPDETARFLMLWMTGLMAPTAFRRGGFVSIEMLVSFLPRALSAALVIVMLVLSLLVLVAAFNIGMSELSGFMARSESPSMKFPTSLDFSTWMKVPRGWMMASFHVGITLLLMVNVELILRAFLTMMGAEDRLPVIPQAEMAGAE